MRIRVLVAVCVFLAAASLSSIASAQTNWQKTYGGAGEERGYSVELTADGGYVIAGYTASFGTGARDVYLIKTNASGDTLWTRTYGGTGSDGGYSVQQTPDGGYIIAGSTSSFGAGRSDFYLLKTNAQGDTLWTRAYGGPDDDRGYSAQPTTDGGYIVAGYTFSFGAGGTDFYLVKTNAQGDTLWTRTYDGSFDPDGNSVQQTSDGGYAVAATSQSQDVYLVKTDAQGETLWTRTYGGRGLNHGNSVRQTTDGGYIIAGCTWSFNSSSYDVYLIRTNAQGETLWTRTYGGPRADFGHSVQQTADGSYVVAGYSYDGTGIGDVYLIKTDGKLDVGPISIPSPTGVVDSGVSYLPRAVIRNFGLTSGKVVQVTMEIGSGYAETVAETLQSVPLDTVEFPAWTAGPVGSLPVTCFTTLFGDEDPANDTIVDSVRVLPSPIHDVGAVAILEPSGSVRAGDTVIPKARIRNFGNREERFFDVRFRIGDNYNEKVNVADALPAGSTAELTFPPWVATAGDWAVTCSTMLGSDENHDNDKVSSSVRVFPQTLSIAPDQSGRIEAGQGGTYRFYALIQGDTGAMVEIARPSPLPGWSARLCNTAGANDLTDSDGDGIPDLGYVAPGESGWFSLAVTAPSATQGDTASLGQGVFLVAGHASDRPDIADTAVLTLSLVPELSIHNFPNPFTGHTTFVIGLPEDGKASLTVYTRAGERVCRIISDSDLPAGVRLVPWDGTNDHGRGIAPGTYEYLLDYVHGGKTARIRKRLVVSRQ